MIIHNMEQRTPEWDAIRAGKITASVASKLLTPGGKPSTQSKSFIGCLIAEELGLQEPEQHVQTEWMDRGVDNEDESRLWLQVELGMRIDQVGFIESDDQLAGFSPDGIIQTAPESVIPCELKNPKPSTHITYLVDGGLPDNYKAQCHFALAITGAPYLWFMSYCPSLRPLLVKVEPDAFTVAMTNAIEQFKADLAAARKIIGE